MDELDRAETIAHIANGNGVEAWSAIGNPEWEKAEKCHDWRNHVPSCIREAWEDMNTMGRLAVVLLASELANAEEWE